MQGGHVVSFQIRITRSHVVAQFKCSEDSGMDITASAKPERGSVGTAPFNALTFGNSRPIHSVTARLVQRAIHVTERHPVRDVEIPELHLSAVSRTAA